MITSDLKQHQDNYLKACTSACYELTNTAFKNSADIYNQASLESAAFIEKTTNNAKADILKAAVNAENSFKISKLLMYALYFAIASSTITGVGVFVLMDKYVIPHTAAAVMEQIQVQQDTKKSKK
jgi:hypothetical protein